ncbi:MAG: glycoside hydrolase family protein [Terriglobia bacterium]
MDIAATMDWIAKWEGSQPRAYVDTQGHPTIGVGFNLDRPDAPGAIGGLGLDYSQVRAGAQELTSAQIQQLFAQDVNAAVVGVRERVRNFDSLPDAAQMVLVDMVFNLGVAGFGNFTHLIGALQLPDWNAVADAMANSLWFNQTGPRSQADVDAIRRLSMV